jgi:putative transcriptional regulator
VSFSLRGQFLVAMPDMEDERFAHTVVYVCSHSEEDGAMGLVVNKLMPDLHFGDLMAQFDIKIVEENDPEKSAYDQPIVVGGPVETGRGFVLHTADFETPENSINISDDLCLSTTMDVLKSIADGHGPSHALLALGYCGWEPGQLEDEIGDNGWLTTPASSDLIFSTPMDKRYTQALKYAGIDIAFLSSTAGHA